MSIIVDFILNFLLSTDTFVFTAYICSDQNEHLELAYKSFDLGIGVQVYNSLNSRNNTFNSGGMILDLSCKEAEKIISESSGKRLFDSTHTWVIFDHDDEPNRTKVELVLKDIDMLPDSNVVWKTRKSLLDVYRTKTKEKLKIKLLDDKVYESSAKYLKSLMNSLPSRVSRRKNLQNIYLRSATIISQPQHFTGWDDLSTKHIDTWPKFTFPIMRNLAQDLNYRNDMKQTDNYGVMQSNGTFDGLCGQLQRGEIEFGITSMFMRKDRWEALDFCAETIVLKSSFMFRQPPQSTVSNIFLLPFSSNVWIASFSLFFLVWSVLSLLSIFMAKSDRSLKSMNPSEIFSLTIGTVCQQGTNLNPYLSSARIIIFFSFVTSLFIFTSYSAKIVALLQTPSTAIKTISDLAHSPMTLGVQETTYKKVYFTESNDPGTKFLYKYKIAPQAEKAYMSVVDGISRMKKSLFAFQVEESSGYEIISKTYTEREKCGLAEIEAFQLPMVAIPIKKQSGYRDIFASRLRWQREVGLFDRIKKIWIAQKPICNEGLTGFVSVGIVECLPAVKTMIYGAVLSIMRHASFLARTVFVQNNNIEEACRVINRILGKEGILEQFRLTRYYEKPFQTRRRVNHEKCKAIYNEDMDRKIQFVLRKNRVEPFPGCQ